MTVKVKFFAMLREMTGREEMTLDFSGGVSCGQVLNSLKNTFADAAWVFNQCMIAVNGQYALPEMQLLQDDEIVFLPPVSGG